MQNILLVLRVITPLIVFLVIWLSYSSFRKGLRKKLPVIFLKNVASEEVFPVHYWENSIGRSRSCDIKLQDDTVSRAHAVLLRRKGGWFICDTGSKSGVAVDGKKIKERTTVGIGDVIQIGKVKLALMGAENDLSQDSRIYNTKTQLPQFLLFGLASIVHLLMALQILFSDNNDGYEILYLFDVLFVVGFIFFMTSKYVFRRKTFEVETIGYLLSGIGILLLASRGVEAVYTQVIAFGIGLVVYLILLKLLSDADFVTKWRIVFAVAAIGLLVVNMLFGSDINGARNWIYIGSISFQPSELVKIVFVMVGVSALDKLQTNRNIGECIIFAGICMAFLFAMRDFGTALVFFAGFLIIAFMRSGSFRTIALIVSVAAFGVLMILYFRPYVMDRFLGWGNVWDYMYESYGYQQTRTLTYMVSGGMFGMGLGNGYLHQIAAAETDLVFGLISEEMGLLMGLMICFAFVVLALIVMADVKRSRSALYSISSCAAVGILLTQISLNIFGSTDVLPLTGVTLPFISDGGTSMIAVWGLLAFIKASDERTYNGRRNMTKS